MSAVQISPQVMVLGVVFLVAAFMVRRSVVRRARVAREAARSSVRVFSLAGRVVVVAAVIAGIQWLVVTHPARNFWTVSAALDVPALLAAVVLVRSLTVTAVGSRSERRHD